MSGVEQNEGPARSGSGGIVLIGFSAGGLGPLRKLLPALRRSIDAPIVIAHHVAKSILPELIACWTPGPVVFARDRDPIRDGQIYVTPPGHHLVINPDATFSVSSRERVNFVRPSIDWLFESGSASFRDRTVAVVLSGGQRDGSRGAKIVRRNGGRVVVQAPWTALHPSMPLAAMVSGATRVVAPHSLAEAIVGELTGLALDSAAAEWEQPFAPYVA